MLTLFGWGSSAAESLPEKTKRWTSAQDGIDKLKQDDIDTPKPKDGEVLVKVTYVSLNYRDLEGL